MELWMSAEVNAEVSLPLRLIRNAIEDQINKHLKEINYANDRLKNWDIIITLRDDDIFDEIIKYSVKKKDTDFHLKIDYNTFLNANEKERKQLIYDLLLRSINILEEKGIENLEIVKEIINKSRIENIDKEIEYYKSIQVKN